MDVPDDYEFLPNKVLSAYQWAYYELDDRSDFYAFTDDDCAINIPHVYDYLASNRKQFITNNTIYCGLHYNPVSKPFR